MVFANRMSLSMVINYFHDLDRGYLVSIDSSVFPLWNRIVGRFKNQPVWMNQIYCILAPSNTYKLVPSIRFGRWYNC